MSRRWSSRPIGPAVGARSYRYDCTVEPAEDGSLTPKCVAKPHRTHSLVPFRQDEHPPWTSMSSAETPRTSVPTAPPPPAAAAATPRTSVPTAPPPPAAAVLRFRAFINQSTSEKKEAPHAYDFAVSKIPKQAAPQAAKGAAEPDWVKQLLVGARAGGGPSAGTAKKNQQKRLLTECAALLKRIRNKNQTADIKQQIVDFGTFVQSHSFQSVDDAVRTIKRRADEVRLKSTSIAALTSVLTVLTERVAFIGTAFIGANVSGDPQYAKFFKMLKMRVPRPAVENKMRAAGLDPSLLDNPDAPAPGVKVIEDPQYAKFFNMLKMRVPRPAVENKMRAAGLNPALLDTPDAPSPSNGGRQEAGDLLGALQQGKELNKTGHSAAGTSGRPQIKVSDLVDGAAKQAAEFFTNPGAPRKLNDALVTGLKLLSQVRNGGLLRDLQEEHQTVSNFVEQQDKFQAVINTFTTTFASKRWAKTVGAIRRANKDPVALSRNGAFDEIKAQATPHPFSEVFAVFQSDRSYMDTDATLLRGTAPTDWLKSLSLNDLRKELCPTLPDIAKSSAPPDELIQRMLHDGFPSSKKHSWRWNQLSNGAKRGTLPTSTTVRFDSTNVGLARRVLLQLVDPHLLSQLFEGPASLSIPSDSSEERRKVAATVTEAKRLGNASLNDLLAKQQQDLSAMFAQTVASWVAASNSVYAAFGLDAEPIPSLQRHVEAFTEHLGFCRAFCERWTTHASLTRVDVTKFIKRPRSQKAAPLVRSSVLALGQKVAPEEEEKSDWDPNDDDLDTYF